MYIYLYHRKRECNENAFFKKFTTTGVTDIFNWGRKSTRMERGRERARRLFLQRQSNYQV